MSTRHSARAPKPSTKLIEATEPSPPPPPEPASKRRKVVAPAAGKGKAAPAPAASKGAGKGKGGKGKGKAAKEEEEEEEDPDRLYCVCRKKDNGDPMVQCEECEEWYHLKCMKITKTEVESFLYYYCPPCIEKSGGKLKIIRTYDISLLPSPPRSTKPLPKGKGDVGKNGKAKLKAGAGKAAGKGAGKAGAKGKGAAAAASAAQTQGNGEDEATASDSSSASSDSEDDKEDEFTIEGEVAAGRTSSRIRQKARDAPVESESDSDREASAREGSSRRSVSTAPLSGRAAPKRRKSSSGPQQAPAKRARQSSGKDEAKSQEKTAAFRNWGRGKLVEGLEPAFVAYHAHRAETRREAAEQEPMEVEDDAVIASTERFLSEAEAKTAAARYAENAEEALFERTKEKNLEGVFTASQSYRRAVQVFQEAFKALRKDLAEGIVTGTIPPDKFASMTSADLASEEQMAERKRLEEASMKQLVRSDDPRQQIRYTKKGLEDAETLQSIHRNIHEAERRVSDAGSAKVEEPATPAPAVESPALDRRQSVTSANGVPATPAQEETDFFKSPSREVMPSATPEAPPIRPAPRQSSFSLSNFIGKPVATQFAPVEAVDEDDGPALPGFTDDNGDNANEAEDGFEAYLSQQERENAAAAPAQQPAGPTPEEELLAMPIIWTGKINNPAVETAGPALVEARQVGGRDINPSDPLRRALFANDPLQLIGRVPIPDSAKYLMNCRLSASKELIIVAFLPAKGEPEDVAVKPYDALAAFHVDRKRHGVIQPYGNEPVPPGAAKELYLVPLERDQSFEFLELMDQLSLPVGLEKTVLLGVFIINKPKDEPAPYRAPPPMPVANGGAPIPMLGLAPGMVPPLPTMPQPNADLSQLLASLNPEALKAATSSGMPPPNMPPYPPQMHANGAPYPYRPQGGYGPGMGNLPPNSPTPPVPTPNAARPPAVHPSRMPFVGGGQGYGPGPGPGQMHDDRQNRGQHPRSPQMQNGGRGGRGPWDR